MLTPGIHGAYEAGRRALEANGRVRRVAEGQAGEGVNRGRGALFVTEAADFLADATLAHEVFGASSLVVRCRDADELVAVTRGLEGQLTATLHLDAADAGDAALARRLMPALETKAGRILANGWPTGVEVSHAMVHGGPYPATADGRSTSVGSLAIRRFLRPVCYQDLPAELLPESAARRGPERPAAHAGRRRGAAGLNVDGDRRAPALRGARGGAPHLSVRQGPRRVRSTRMPTLRQSG